MKGGTSSTQQQQQQQQHADAHRSLHSTSTLTHQQRMPSWLASATVGSANGPPPLPVAHNTKPAKFVISRPIRGIMLNPLQVKVLVPRVGRSVEYQLSRAVPDPTGVRPQPGAEDPALTQALKAAQESVYLSVQAQRAADEGCTASMCPHTHFDLVIRLVTRSLAAAHLLCKVVYQNVRGELKEMGPYMLHAVDQVSSYRLEEMNCKVSAKTGHHHIYLLLQLTAAVPSQEAQPDRLLRAPRPKPQGPPPQHLPSHAELPEDFTVQWSPLATLRLVSANAAGPEDPRPVHCVPQLMALVSEEIRDLLLTGVSTATGTEQELVLQGVSHGDLELLARLTYPGTPCAVTAANVLQVLQLATKLRVPHLLATADRLLCDCATSDGAGAVSRAELASLASQYRLRALTETLRQVG